MVLSAEKNREYLRRHRERNRARGLTGHGTPLKRVGNYSHASPEYLNTIRRDALEMIAWTRAADSVHAFAGNLPLEWWRVRDNQSVNTIIDAIRQEMERA